ncbi:alpha/beta fold hydrolase [Verticiella sediminum]|nr:alpha/beta fold hydrolase [Verticiella sediminum]
MPGPAIEEAHYEIPGFRFESGEQLPSLRIAYTRYGTLNAARDNLLLVMPGTGNVRHSAAGHVGPGLAYDPSRYCVVLTDGIGGGDSSRPSEGLRERFPRYTVRDMARAHHLLARDGLGLGATPVAVVAGASMGAFQALEYAVHYPEHAAQAVLLVPACRAGTLFRNVVRQLIDTVRLDPAWQDGAYRQPPLAGLRAAGRHYFPWTVSDDYLDSLTEAQAAAACAGTGEWFAQWDAWDLLRRYEASAAHDVGQPFGGETARALAGVRARTLVLACEQDRLLGMSQAQCLARGIPRAELAVFASPKGHLAWRPDPGSPQTAAIARIVRQFLGLSVDTVPQTMYAGPAAPIGEG